MTFTPTEQRILELLADGLPHTRKELMSCLFDELSSQGALRVRLCNLNIKLERRGQRVVCELRKGVFYRHVRLLASDTS